MGESSIWINKFCSLKPKSVSNWMISWCGFCWSGGCSPSSRYVFSRDGCTLHRHLRVGHVLETEATIADYHETVAGASTSSGKDLHWQVGWYYAVTILPQVGCYYAVTILPQVGWYYAVTILPQVGWYYAVTILQQFNQIDAATIVGYS